MTVSWRGGTMIEGGQKGQQIDHICSRNQNARACVDILGYLYIPPSTYIHEFWLHQDELHQDITPEHVLP